MPRKRRLQSGRPPSAERLREMVWYDPDEGRFYWRSPGMGVTVGKEVGWVSGRWKRWHMQIDQYRTHRARFAYLYMTGEMPPAGLEIDHINEDGLDDRWGNLRLATRSQNAFNRTFTKTKEGNRCLPRGVHLWVTQNESIRYRAKIRRRGRSRYLGSFRTPEAAQAAYAAAAAEHFGAFATMRSDILGSQPSSTFGRSY